MTIKVFATSSVFDAKIDFAIVSPSYYYAREERKNKLVNIHKHMTSIPFIFLWIPLYIF